MLQTDPSQSSILTLDAAGQDAVTVPGGAWMLKADFSVQGSDLLLTGTDGAQVLIRDFFSSDTPPDLMTDGGAVIPANLSVHLAGPQAPGQFALIQNGPFQIAQGAEEPVGKVEATDGLVEAIRTDGSKVTLVKGSPIFQGDTVVTAKGAAIGITFVDDTTFSLGEDGRMVLDEMVYDPGGADNTFNANLVQGVFSFVSGQIAKTSPEGMTVSTPVATIGIRGTKVAGRAAQEGSENTITLLPEFDAQGNAFVGNLIVFNQGGTVTLNQIGATVQLSSSFTAPPPPVIFSPQQIQQQFSSALNSLPAQAVRNPVNNNDDDAAPADDAPAAGDAPPPEGDTPPEGDAPPEGGEQLAEGDAVPEGDLPPLGEGGTPPPEGEIIQNLDGSGLFGGSEGDAIDEFFGTGGTIGVEINYEADVGEAFNPPPIIEGLTGDKNIDPNSEENPEPGELEDPNGNEDPILGDSQFLEGQEEPLFELYDFNFADALAEEDKLLLDLGRIENDDPFSQTTNTFDEVLYGTTGDDPIVGNDGNSRIVMAQGTTLGGNDTIDGGLGTDEVAVQNLDSLALIYNASTSPNAVSYSGFGGSFTGTATLTSIEQVYADDGVETFGDTSGTGASVKSNGVRLEVSPSDTGQGYIIAGGAGNDTISLANSTNLISNYSALTGAGTTVTSGSVLGSIIFGKGGDDIITGSEAGDIIFGGIGFDTINTGGSTSTSGGELIFGGGGNDTINVAAMTDGSAFVGGGGGDTLNYGSLTGPISFAVTGSGIATSRTFNSVTVNDFINSIEFIYGTAGVNTYNLSGDTTTQGVVILRGSASNDIYNVNSGTLVTATLDGLGGVDSVNLLGTGNYSLQLSAIENINGSAGNEAVTLTNTQLAGMVNLLGGTDSLALAVGTNTFTALNIESITGNTGADTITLGAAQASGTVNLAGGVDSLSLFNGTNTLTVTDVETVNGGTGVDTLTINGSSATTVTGGGGADTLTFSGTGIQTAKYTALADGGDTVNGFLAGASGDIFQFATSFGGAQTISLTLESAAGAGTTGANVIVADLSLLSASPATALIDVQDLLLSMHTANAFVASTNKFVIGIIDNDSDSMISTGDQYALYYDADVTTGDAVLIATTDIDAQATAASTWDATNFSAVA